MDMNMYPVVPELTDLPLSDPRCRNESCNAFLDAENESQATISWLYQFEYGHWVTYYYVIIIGILMIIHIAHTLRDRKARVGNQKSKSVYQRIVACGRFISYRRISTKPLDFLGLPSCGMLAFLLTTVLFLVVLMFAVKPYYREHYGYGSPPLAIRTGLMAFACTPILIALAGKANIITLLTGISHEKLNVVHRWVAWMSFGLALVHTIPFLLASYWDGPFYSMSGNDNVTVQLYAYGTGGGSEFSGVPALAILFALCVLSLPYIRNRFYESFYYSHVLLGITYLGLLFWHAADIEDSWAYLWATLALWVASYFARVFWYTKPLNIRSQWFSGAPTTMHKLPGGMTRLDLLAPIGFSCTPAQHCFLRFPGISILDNHPFTIISSPGSADSISSKEGGHQAIISFLARTHNGFTRKLEGKYRSQPDNLVYAWIDGPYGGINRPVENLYDNIVLIAGGSGISACLPWLLYIKQKGSASDGPEVRVKQVTLVWVMKETEHFAWASEFLTAASAYKHEQTAVEMRLKFYVTGDVNIAIPLEVMQKEGFQEGVRRQELRGRESKEQESTVLESRGSMSSASHEISRLGKCSQGRPSMSTIVNETVGSGKTFVFGCGPESLRTDLSNACADIQTRAMKQEVQEVEMHLESFGW